MALLEIGEIMIDEDEAMEKAHLAGRDEVVCPKCGTESLIIGANYCYNCGQKVTWFTQEVGKNG
jgi:hypothetical protein